MNWGQALARAHAFRHARANETPAPKVVTLTEQYSSMEAINRLMELTAAVLPLLRYRGRPEPGASPPASSAGANVVALAAVHAPAPSV